MASTIVTANQDAIVSEIHIAAPPERVFQALIDPKQVSQMVDGRRVCDRVLRNGGEARWTLAL